jgi:hypothetical protein
MLLLSVAVEFAPTATLFSPSDIAAPPSAVACEPLALAVSPMAVVLAPFVVTKLPGTTWLPRPVCAFPSGMKAESAATLMSAPASARKTLFMIFPHGPGSSASPPYPGSHQSLGNISRWSNKVAGG